MLVMTSYTFNNDFKMEMIFMKLKLATKMLSIISFMVGTAGCVMIFTKGEVPSMMVSLCTILLIMGCMSELITTRKLRKLGYPLIIIYFLVCLPIIERVMEKKLAN